MSSVSEQLKDALYDSFYEVLYNLGFKDTNIVFANQGGIEPDKTYCILNIIRIRQKGRTDESTAGAHSTAKMQFTNYYNVDLQVTFLGKSADNVAMDFDIEIGSNVFVRHSFQKHLLAVVDKQDAINVPQLRGNEWMPSWNIDLNLSYAVQGTQVLNDWVETFVAQDPWI